MKKQFNPAIGERIKRLRIMSGMTQSDLAQAIGYATTAPIVQIEAGRRRVPPKRLQAFADALGVQVEMLTAEEEPKFPFSAAPYIMRYDPALSLADNTAAAVNQMLCTYPASEYSRYALLVTRSAVVPRITPGDIVVVDQCPLAECTPGDAIVMIDEQGPCISLAAMQRGESTLTVSASPTGANALATYAGRVVELRAYAPLVRNVPFLQYQDIKASV